MTDGPGDMPDFLDGKRRPADGPPFRVATRTTAKFVVFCAVALLSCKSSAAPDRATVRAALANAAYVCPVIVMDGSGSAFDDGFTLHDGGFEGPPDPPDSEIRPSASLDNDYVASGDLNGDGKLDAAAVVWEYGGGTGSSAVLYVFDDVLGSKRCTHSIGLGDRIKLARLEVVGEETVLVEFKQHAFGEGMATEPTESVARKFLLSPESASAIDRQADGSWQPHHSEFWRVVVEPSRRLAAPKVASSSPAGRRLKVRVEPVLYNQSGFGRAAVEAAAWNQENRLSTALLREVEAEATADGLLHLRFDVARRNHEIQGIPFATNACCQKLRFILYDDHGLELERFWTAEHFGTDVVLVRSAGPPARLIGWTGNDLTYPVLRRDLDEATSVTVGFGYAFGAMEREPVRRAVSITSPASE